MNDTSPREFRLRRGSSILGYIQRFSSTEKAIFGALAAIAIVSAAVLFVQADNYFMVEVPAHGGELREGEVGLPRTVNPVLAVTDTDKDIAALAYSGLMRYEGDALVPDAAASWHISADGLTYDFILREDAVFSDGAPLTADDIVFTIQKIQDPALKSPRRADWTSVTAKAVSPAEVQFTLKQPYSPFLANTTVGIIPKHIWGGVSDDQFIFSQYNLSPIGSGPYAVDSILQDKGGIPTQYSMVSRESYGKQAYIRKITFNFFADEDSALSALDAGTIDSLAAISPHAASKLSANSAEAYAIISSPLPRVFGMFMNQNQAPVLADKSVRQALDISIDRQAIIRTVLNGYAEPISGPLPISMSHTAGGQIGTSPKTDPAGMASASTTANDNIARAQALLEKNGWKKDNDGIYEKKTKTSAQVLSFDIYTADATDLKQAADLAQKSWTKLGAQVTVKVFEQSDLYQNIIRPRKYDMLLFGEVIGKDRDIYAFWHSSQRNAPGLNVSLYVNGKADKLLDDIRSTRDEKTKSADYIALDALIRDDIPAIFLYDPDFIYAVPKDIRGTQLRAVTIPADRFNSVSDWYIETEKVWDLPIFKNK